MASYGNPYTTGSVLQGRRLPEYLLTSALLIVLSIPALLPMLTAPAWDAHDGLHHIFRSAAFFEGIRSGLAYPRWASSLGFGYGFPVTHYYAPLAYYLVAAWQALGVNILDAIKLVYACGFIISALGMYSLARLTLGNFASFIAAAAYAYYPYHIADLYMRGTLTEFLALTLLPLVAWSAIRTAQARGRGGARLRYMAIGGVLLALLILTHNLTAFVFLPGLALYLGLRFRQTLFSAATRHGAWIASSIVLAFSLTAFYWLPALGETSWIRAGQVAGAVDEIAALLPSLSRFVSQSFLQFYGLTPADLQHPLGLAVALCCACSIAASCMRWRALTTVQRAEFFAWFSIAGLTIFAMTDLSASLWAAISPLSILQFPFRLHANLGLALAMLIGIGTEAAWGACTTRQARVGAGAGALIAIGLLMASALGGLTIVAKTLPRSKEPLDASQINVVGMSEYDYQTALWARLYGGVWLFEYMPAWVTEAREDFFLPRAVLPSAAAPLAATVTPELYAPEARALRVNAPAPFRLSFHTFYFPPWQVRVDGAPVATYPYGPLALVSADIPAGEHRVALVYDGTPFSTAGAWLSLIALVGLLAVLVVAHRRTGLALTAGVVVVAVVWFWPAGAAQAVSAIQPANATFDGRVTLIGYRTSRAAYRPGETADITLFWFVRRAPAEDYKVFVHLDGAAGRAGQVDGQPGLNFSPTTRWQAGEIIADPYRVRIAPNAAPGPYDILAGMYRMQPVQNLPVESPAATPDNRVRLGTLEIVSP